MCCFTLLKAVLSNKNREKAERRHRSTSRKRRIVEKMKGCCPYAILEIPQEADMNDIKQARNNKLKIHHPDKLTYASSKVRKKSEELSKLINWAYEELSEKRLRA